MMKKIFGFALVAILVGGLSGNASALGFGFGVGAIDLTASVNPNVGGSYTGPPDVTGTASYILGVDAASSHGANYLRLRFEDDIFAAVSGVTVSIPGDWTYALSSFNSAINLELGLSGTTGTTLLPGESIVVSVDYTLTNTLAFSSYSGVGPDFVWSIDGPEPWNQGVIARLYGSSGALLADGAGSTTVPTPEPASLVLMGTGLLGLGLWSRRRKKA